jgi:glycosyltransferase involved in cell wall biosynthesis
MKFSFIIPTLNREDQYTHCVESILASHENEKNPAIEILVIFQGIREPAKAAVKYPGSVTPYAIRQTGLSAARNHGITQSKGDFLIFIDDDAEIAPDFIKALSALIVAFPADAYCGRLFDKDKKEYFSKFFSNEHAKTLGFFEFKHFKGSAHILSRKCVDALGGYDESLGAGARFGGAEESDIFFRLKQRKMNAYYSPDLVVYHPIRLSKGKVFDYARSVSAMLTKQLIIDKKRALVYASMLSQLLAVYSLRALQTLLFPGFMRAKNDLFQYKLALKGTLSGILDYPRSLKDFR